MGTYTRVPEDLLTRALDGDEFMLYVMMLSYAWNEPKCWPSRKTLAELTGWSVSKVQRVMGRLVEEGFVVKHRRAGRSTMYELTVWCPAGKYEAPMEKGVKLTRRIVGG